MRAIDIVGLVVASGAMLFFIGPTIVSLCEDLAGMFADIFVGTINETLDGWKALIKRLFKK